MTTTAIALILSIPLCIAAALFILLLMERAKGRRRREEITASAQQAIRDLRRELAAPPARGADPSPSATAPGVPQTQAELEQKAAAFDRFGQVQPELPAGLVRAEVCEPGMVEVKVVMPPGHEEMHKAMSAHEGGNGKGVSLADPHKNSASFLGGD